MEQKEIVREFIKSLGMMKPPVISTDLFKNFIKNIIIDSESMEEFIVYSDRFIKHSQTFQMAFLLHSLASVTAIAPTGDPIGEVRKSVKTIAFDIPIQEMVKIISMDEAQRYSELCEKLLEYNSDEAKRLDKRIVDDRNNPDHQKIDDGTDPNQLFDPMETKFPTQSTPGDDLTEDLEIKDYKD